MVVFLRIGLPEGADRRRSHYFRASPMTTNKRLQSRFVSDPYMRPLLEEYASELAEKVAILKKALATGDLKALQHWAHDLKGSGGGYGFPEITRCAGDLEKAIKTASVPGELKTRLDELVNVLRSVEGYDQKKERCLESESPAH